MNKAKLNKHSNNIYEQRVTYKVDACSSIKMGLKINICFIHTTEFLIHFKHITSLHEKAID